MASNLKMTKDRLGDVLASMRGLAEGAVLVGIPAEDAFRKPEPGEPKDVNNAMLGYVHELGSPAKNIPARPFLIPGVRNAQEKIADLFERDIKRQLGPGGGRDMDQTLHAVGLVAQSAVRAKITDGPFVPLKPQTLSKRRAKGRTGTSPLIDTGQLKNSINYVVKDGS